MEEVVVAVVVVVVVVKHELEIYTGFVQLVDELEQVMEYQLHVEQVLDLNSSPRQIAVAVEDVFVVDEENSMFPEVSWIHNYKKALHLLLVYNHNQQVVVGLEYKTKSQLADVEMLLEGSMGSFEHRFVLGLCSDWLEKIVVLSKEMDLHDRKRAILFFILGEER